MTSNPSREDGVASDTFYLPQSDSYANDPLKASPPPSVSNGNLFEARPPLRGEMDVLLVGLNDDLGEARALIGSAGYRLKGEFLQRRDHPDSKYFVGKGKLEELKKVVKETGVDVVVFAGTLRPSQHHELEKALHAQCFDRLRLILEIFSQRAHNREAMLQVELAMLQYEVPILKEWIHSGTAGERPGFMAGGEYRVDAYYETVKRKMKKIRDDLQLVRKERARRRDHRHDRGFYHVSIAGYANAGKSSLFNALSGERVLVEDRPFTTLSTTTRALKDVRRRILITDTVGLVSDVPLWLIEAFHSTFEEVFASDLVLLLVDASDSLHEIEAKLHLAENTLLSGMDADRIQLVLSKADLASPEVRDRCLAAFRGSMFVRSPVPVSATTGEGLEDLRTLITAEFRQPLQLTVRVSQGGGSAAFMNWLHDETDIVDIAYEERVVNVRLHCRERDLPRIHAGGEVVEGPTEVT